MLKYRLCLFPPCLFQPLTPYVPFSSPRGVGVCRDSGGRVGREISLSRATSGFMSMCSGTHLCLFPGGQQACEKRSQD